MSAVMRAGAGGGSTAARAIIPIGMARDERRRDGRGVWAGGPLRVPPRPDRQWHGPGRGRGQDRRAVRARDVAAQLRALLPHQEPAALGEETKQLALRNWSEELRLVDNVILRAVQLCTSILTEEQVNLDPLRQVRRGLPQEGRRRRPLHREAGPPGDARGRPHPAARVPRGPAPRPDRPGASCPASPTRPSPRWARSLYREIRRSHLLALLIDKKFKPIHDRITQPGHGGRSSAASPTRAERRQAAKVFLEFFRLLHYLEYADPETRRRGRPARTRS